VTAIEKIAREFHEAYERLAPSYGYETRDESAVPWDEVPSKNKSLMRGVVADLLARGVITAGSHPLTPSTLEATGTTRDEHRLTG
jgi:hypothetical protein